MMLLDDVARCLGKVRRDGSMVSELDAQCKNCLRRIDSMIGARFVVMRPPKFIGILCPAKITEEA